jgi:hypothetical protein
MGTILKARVGFGVEFVAREHSVGSALLIF